MKLASHAKPFTDFSAKKVTGFLTAICAVVLLLNMTGTAVSQTAAPTRQVIRGTVTAVNNGVLTITPDTGTAVMVEPDPEAKIQKLAPGSTDLKSAEVAEFADISVGDRVLISAIVPDSGPDIARIIVVMKASDIQQRNTADQADWQKRGIGGLVRAVDPMAKTVTISVVTAAGTTKVQIQTSPKTVVKRYAADSVNYSDAQVADFSLIRMGDQLKARGDKSADGATLTADEIVTGSFRNISGLITSIDAVNKTVTIKDLATKASVVVLITGNTDMHKLNPMAANMFAQRLKGGAGAGPGAGGGQAGGGQSGGAGGQGGGRMRSASFDLTQMISRMPTVTLADLHVGDALMIAATASDKANQVTAITLLGGVEPILAASPNDNSMTLAPWSLGGGGDMATE